MFAGIWLYDRECTLYLNVPHTDLLNLIRDRNNSKKLTQNITHVRSHKKVGKMSDVLHMTLIYWIHTNLNLIAFVYQSVKSA